MQEIDLNQHEVLEHEYEDLRFGTIQILNNPQTNEMIMSKRIQLMFKDQYIKNLEILQQRKNINNRNILNLLQIKEDETNLSLEVYYEYPTNDIITMKDQLSTDLNLLKQLIEDILNSLLILKRNNFVHSDISPEYIYYNNDTNNFVLLDRLKNQQSFIEAQKDMLQKQSFLYQSPNLFDQLVNDVDDIEIDPYKEEIFQLGMVIVDILSPDEYNFQKVYNFPQQKFDKKFFDILKQKLQFYYFYGENRKQLGDILFQKILNTEQKVNIQEILDSLKQFNQINEENFDFNLQNDKQNFNSVQTESENKDEFFNINVNPSKERQTKDSMFQTFGGDKLIQSFKMKSSIRNNDNTFNTSMVSEGIPLSLREKLNEAESVHFRDSFFKDSPSNRECENEVNVEYFRSLGKDQNLQTSQNFFDNALSPFDVDQNQDPSHTNVHMDYSKSALTDMSNNLHNSFEPYGTSYPSVNSLANRKSSNQNINKNSKIKTAQNSVQKVIEQEDEEQFLHSQKFSQSLDCMSKEDLTNNDIHQNDQLDQQISENTEKIIMLKESSQQQSHSQVQLSNNDQESMLKQEYSIESNTSTIKNKKNDKQLDLKQRRYSKDINIPQKENIIKQSDSQQIFKVEHFDLNDQEQLEQDEQNQEQQNEFNVEQDQKKQEQQNKRRILQKNYSGTNFVARKRGQSLLMEGLCLDKNTKEKLKRLIEQDSKSQFTEDLSKEELQQQIQQFFQENKQLYNEQDYIDFDDQSLLTLDGEISQKSAMKLQKDPSNLTLVTKLSKNKIQLQSASRIGLKNDAFELQKLKNEVKADEEKQKKVQQKQQQRLSKFQEQNELERQQLEFQRMQYQIKVQEEEQKKKQQEEEDRLKQEELQKQREQEQRLKQEEEQKQKQLQEEQRQKQLQEEQRQKQLQEEQRQKQLQEEQKQIQLQEELLRKKEVENIQEEEQSEDEILYLGDEDLKKLDLDRQESLSANTISVNNINVQKIVPIQQVNYEQQQIENIQLQQSPKVIVQAQKQTNIQNVFSFNNNQQVLQFVKKKKQYEDLLDKLKKDFLLQQEELKKQIELQRSQYQIELEQQKQKIDEERALLNKNLQDERSKIEIEKAQLNETLQKEKTQIEIEKAQLHEVFKKVKNNLESEKAQFDKVLEDQKIKVETEKEQINKILQKEKNKVEIEKAQINQMLEEERSKVEIEKAKLNQELMSERQKFEEQKQNLDKQYVKKKTEIDEKEKSIIDNYETQKKSQLKTLESITSQITNNSILIENQKKELQKDFEEYKDQLQQEKVSIQQKFQEEKKSILDQKKEIQQQLEQEQLKLTQQKKQLEEEKNNLEKILEEKRKNMKNETEIFEKDFVNQKQEKQKVISNLENQICQLEVQIKNLEEQRGQKQQEVEELVIWQQGIQADIESNKKVLQEYKEAIERNKQQLMSFQEEQKQLEAIRIEHQEKTQQQLNSQKKNISKIKQNLRKLLKKDEKFNYKDNHNYVKSIFGKLKQKLTKKDKKLNEILEIEKDKMQQQLYEEQQKFIQMQQDFQEIIDKKDDDLQNQLQLNESLQKILKQQQELIDLKKQHQHKIQLIHVILSNKKKNVPKKDNKDDEKFQLQLSQLQDKQKEIRYEQLKLEELQKNVKLELDLLDQQKWNQETQIETERQFIQEDSIKEKTQIPLKIPQKKYESKRNIPAVKSRNIGFERRGNSSISTQGNTQNQAQIDNLPTQPQSNIKKYSSCQSIRSSQIFKQYN